MIDWEYIMIKNEWWLIMMIINDDISWLMMAYHGRLTETDWLISWLVDWAIDPSTDWLIKWSIEDNVCHNSNTEGLSRPVGHLLGSSDCYNTRKLCI